MRSTELRIGNTIHQFGIETNVTPAMILSLSQIESAGKKCIDLSPIPLTEEWLVKFGFEKVGRFYRRGAITAEVCNNFCRLCLCGKFITNKEFVHSLQNLYFCLSKKELI